LCDEIDEILPFSGTQELFSTSGSHTDKALDAAGLFSKRVFYASNEQAAAHLAAQFMIRGLITITHISGGVDFSFRALSEGLESERGNKKKLENPAVQMKIALYSHVSVIH